MSHDFESWCRLGKKLWGRNMAISIAITKRLTTRFEAGLLPVVNAKNELTNAVGLASGYDHETDRAEQS